jgi:hypothetical protein
VGQVFCGSNDVLQGAGCGAGSHLSNLLVRQLIKLSSLHLHRDCFGTKVSNNRRGQNKPVDELSDNFGRVVTFAPLTSMEEP